MKAWPAASALVLLADSDFAAKGMAGEQRRALVEQYVGAFRKVEGDDEGPSDVPIGADPSQLRWYDSAQEGPRMPVNMPIRVRYVMGSRPMTDTEL